MSTDPVGEGLVESLAHPEGNVTGFSFFATPTTGKLLEVLKEIIPGLSQLGVIDEPEVAANSTYLGLVRAAAAPLNITLYTEHVRTASDFKPAFDVLIRARVQAVTASGQGLAYAHRKTVIALALERRLPVAGGQPFYTREGALISFGANPVEIWARAATYIDRILKGTKIADLPVEQPARYQLIVNQKTARTLGLTIPQSVLLRADEVIDP
jgi:putative tryptophan/tyrosine transport system substrate-binding protein